LFQPAAFTLNETRDEVRGPGGATTRTRKRAERGHGWRFAFSLCQCRVCPVRAQCVKPDTQRGRTVIKRDYEAQDQRARQRAQTAAYHAVRYRGRLGVKIQYVLTAIVVNCKRMVTLLALPPQPQLA
jgi:IS5 family transposase